MKEFFPKDKANMEVNATAAPPLAPAALDGSVTNRIDKSQLAIAEPKRLRDKAHLKFVASQPCLICGRQPAILITCGLPNPGQSASKSAMSSRCRSAAGIIGSCIRQAMKRRGGPRAILLRWRSLRIYGRKRVQSLRPLTTQYNGRVED